jgi:hypothetical protein
MAGELHSTRCDFPEMAFRICERAAAPAPWRSFRWLRDLRAGLVRFGKDFIDASFRADV